MYVLSLMSTSFTYPEYFGNVAFALDSELVFEPVDELFLVQRKRLLRGSERKDCLAPLDNFVTRTCTRHHHVASMVNRAAVIHFAWRVARLARHGTATTPGTDCGARARHERDS